jgi:hypothetical protein
MTFIEFIDQYKDNPGDIGNITRRILTEIPHAKELPEFDRLFKGEDATLFRSMWRWWQYDERQNP